MKQKIAPKDKKKLENKQMKVMVSEQVLIIMYLVEPLRIRRRQEGSFKSTRRD
jgi:hypothetical protein